MRMLIIDDSAVMRRALAVMAEHHGFEVEEAMDGQQALEKLCQPNVSGTIDVALVDWDLPLMNGTEFVLAVRSRHEFDRIKLMMVTVDNSEERLREALAVGADDYLMKPVTREAFTEKLRWLGLVE